MTLSDLKLTIQDKIKGALNIRIEGHKFRLGTPSIKNKENDRKNQIKFIIIKNNIAAVISSKIKNLKCPLEIFKILLLKMISKKESKKTSKNSKYQPQSRIDKSLLLLCNKFLKNENRF